MNTKFRTNSSGAPIRLYDHAERVRSARAVCEAARLSGAASSVQIAAGDAAYAGESPPNIEAVVCAKGGTAEQAKAAAAAVDVSLLKVVTIQSDQWQHVLAFLS